MLRATFSFAWSSSSWAGGAPLRKVPRAQCPFLYPPLHGRHEVSAITPLTGREHDFSSTPIHLLGGYPDFTCPFAVWPRAGSHSQPFGLLPLPDALGFFTSLLTRGPPDTLLLDFVHLSPTPMANPDSLREVPCPAGINGHRRH